MMMMTKNEVQILDKTMNISLKMSSCHDKCIGLSPSSDLNILS